VTEGRVTGGRQTVTQNATQQIVNSQNLTGIFDSVENPLVVNVNGFVVNVGGRVIDGIFRIGTFYIK